MFSSQIVPKTCTCKYHREFQQVEQGDISVFEHVKKFNKLLMYASQIFHIKEENIETFVSGLHQEIRPFVINVASKGVFINVYGHALFIKDTKG